MPSKKKQEDNGDASIPPVVVEPPIYRDVSFCPRCGGDHLELPYIRFEFKFATGDENKLWTTCPETGEPIIIG